MSSIRPFQWRYAQLRDQSTGAGSGANHWLSTYHWPGPDIAAGETVIRTRLQMNMTFGWSSNLVPGTDIDQPWYQGQSVLAGLYADPTLPSTDAPPSVGLDVSDGNWIMNDAMTVHAVNYYTNVHSQTSAEVTFKIDTGLSESFGKRGPYTVDPGTVSLVWDIQSFSTYYELNETAFFGWMGGQARWAVLVQEAA